MEPITTEHQCTIIIQGRPDYIGVSLLHQYLPSCSIDLSSATHTHKTHTQSDAIHFDVYTSISVCLPTGRFWKTQEKIPLDKVLQVIDNIIIVEIINVKNNDDS